MSATRLLAVCLAILTFPLSLGSCSRIAVLKEITPVFTPESSPEVTVSVPSHAASFRKATRFERKQPVLAAESYLSLLQDLSTTLRRDPSDREARRAYNFALDRVFSLIRAHRYDPWSRPLRLGRYTLTWDKSPRLNWHPSDYEFLPTNQVEVGGEYLKHTVMRPGLGSSLVAIGREPLQDFRKIFAQARTYYGMSAVAEFQGSTCQISFLDPLDSDDVRVAGHRFPLRADFTTPLAVLLTRERPEKLGLVRLLDPDKYAETARLSRLRPYDDGRIPLLLVHGLLDTPATWVPMVNALRADPVIRHRYQIWVYSYPSGYPYPYSASLLRKELDKVRAAFPRHREMVYVGHSMGGMIGRLMITDSGDAIWNAFFHEPPDRVDMPSREKKLMEDMLLFQARPDISRAVFICSPHRGAKMAGSWIGRLGRSLVRIPKTMIEIGDALRQVVTFSEGGLAYESIPTSIDSLTETNVFVKTVDQLPVSPRIPYHSIIGDRGKPKARLHPELGSDGYVPWTSSHLPGAASELIIPSNHTGHQHPAGIAEVIRILHLHLKSGRR